MIPKTKNCGKLSTVLFLVFILHPVLSELQSADEYQRPKRTIGFLFRSFVNAFQTQRQPEPTVHSYQPLKQTKQPTASQSTLHSTKTDLLASSKNIFEQKKNLFKPPSTRAPEVNLVKQQIQTHPNQNHPATQIQPQSQPCCYDSLQVPPPTQVHPTHTPQFATHNTLLNFHSPNVPLQPQPPHKVVSDPYKTSYERLPLNSSPANLQIPKPNSIPSSNQHPHLPLKAQIFILPFEEDHAAAPPFPEISPETSLPVENPPINYQAELYLQPSAIPMTGNHYSTRFSASNGWRDVEDIISRGNQQPHATKEYNKNTNTVTPETPYNPAEAHEETKPKYPERIPSSDNQSGNQENYIGEYNQGSLTESSFRSHEQHSVPPLFVPQVHQSTSFSPEPYKNENNELDRSFRVHPTFAYGEFEHSVEQTYRYPHESENLKDPHIVLKENQNSKDIQNFINDPNSKLLSSSHGYEQHRREDEVEFGENLAKTNYYDQTFFGNTESDPQNLYPYIQDNSFGIIQYPTRIGRLPDFMAGYF